MSNVSISRSNRIDLKSFARKILINRRFDASRFMFFFLLTIESIDRWSSVSGIEIISLQQHSNSISFAWDKLSSQDEKLTIFDYIDYLIIWEKSAHRTIMSTEKKTQFSQKMANKTYIVFVVDCRHFHLTILSVGMTANSVCFLQVSHCYTILRVVYSINRTEIRHVFFSCEHLTQSNCNLERKRISFSFSSFLCWLKIQQVKKRLANTISFIISF